MMSFLVTGCLNDLFDQDDNTFEGPSQLGWQNANTSFTRSVNEPAGGGAATTTTVNVQLIGAQESSDMTAPFTVGGTAQAGVHYNVTTPSPVTIAANTSSAPVIIQLLDSPLTAGQTRTIILTLQDGSRAIAAENFKTFTITINGRD